MAENQKIIPINIEEEMKSAYIDYSMSVIVSRALPDVRDGLKPVHRRILFAMNELGLTFNKAHKKSARVVGEVLGKYHPRGDTAVYDAMVRMGQDWSLRYPLIDGQGNYGHVDGDSPAAMRYTEARLSKIADEVLSDIKKNTVDFQLNFDDSIEEPTVLPSKVPNLLVNGASGIAVGMATNMLPHNLTEVCDGIIATVNNPEITVDELMQHIKAPDFPTGGIIYGTEGVRQAFETGRGKVILRGKAEIETTSAGREKIVITEIPYQVPTSSLEKKIADLVKDGRIEGISSIENLSDRKGLRIVVGVKQDSIASVVLSKLYKYTQLQSSYGVNNVALVDGRPRLLSLKQIIEEFIKFRLVVIVRKTQFELEKAEERAHILEGLLIALDNIDEVIEIIRGSATADDAREALMKRFELSDRQAKAILEMRLQRLVGLERDKLKAEYDELLIEIDRLKGILADEGLQRGIIIDDLEMLRDKFGDQRRTEITFAEGEISIEDMIANEEVVVTISHLGYIKRTKIEEYRVQSRGGTGSKGSRTRDADFIEHLFVAHTHNYLLLFTEQGRCYWLRVYQIPEASKTASGRVLQNIVSLPKDDKVKAYINIQDLTDTEFLDSHYIIFCTKKGNVKKTSVEAFSRPRMNGINAITINEGDQLLEVRLTNGKQHIILGNKAGRAIRFEEEKVRSMGRTAAGVRGMRLAEDDEVVGMVSLDPAGDASILVVSENGYGKRTELSEYNITNRGGKGVKTMQITKKTGSMVTLKSVVLGDQLIITNRSGIVIRMSLKNIRAMGRATQGVRLINLKDGDQIADVAVIRDSNGDDEEE